MRHKFVLSSQYPQYLFAVLHSKRPPFQCAVSPVLEGVVGKTHVTAGDLRATRYTACSLLHSLMALSAVFQAFAKVCGSVGFIFG